MARALILPAGVKRERANALSRQRMKDRAMMQVVEVAARVANEVLSACGWHPVGGVLATEPETVVAGEIVELMGKMLDVDYRPSAGREAIICAVINGLMERKG